MKLCRHHPRTAHARHRTTNVVHSRLRTRSIIEGGRGCNNFVPVLRENGTKISPTGPIDVVGSFRCTSSARMAGSSLNLWRTTFSTAAKKMLDNSGDNTHPCRSHCFTSNQSEQTPSSGRTQALIPSWKIMQASSAYSTCPTPHDERSP